MAYDHFWYRPRELDATRFSALVADIRHAALQLPASVVLLGPAGAEAPVFTEDLIQFCGDGQYAHFWFPRVLEVQDWEIERAKSRPDGLYFQDCRTGGLGHRASQDFFVCACLLAIQHHFPEVIVKSDGYESDWADTIRWYTDLFKERNLMQVDLIPDHQVNLKEFLRSLREDDDLFEDDGSEADE